MMILCDIRVEYTTSIQMRNMKDHMPLESLDGVKILNEISSDYILGENESGVPYWIVANTRGRSENFIAYNQFI
jgi:hypothetical protein